MNKRLYIAPDVEIIKIGPYVAVAASISIGEGEASAEQSFANENRGAWGNRLTCKNWGDDIKILSSHS